MSCIPKPNSVEIGTTVFSPGGEQLTEEACRLDIVKQIFGEIGELFGDFSCAVESHILLHGRLYVTDRFLCFYSNLFGLEKKIRIPYSHITNLLKENTALVFPNAIAITTTRKEYRFRSFWDRDECFKLIGALVSKNKGDLLDNEYDINNSSLISPIDGFPNGNGEQTSTEDDEVITAVRSHSFLNQVQSFDKEIDAVRLRHQVAGPYILNIDIDNFCQLFVDDDADYSIKRHHLEHKDRDVEISQWSGDDVNESFGCTRELRFIKPINIMGVPWSRATKLQRYRRFGPAGLIVCSSTRCEDIPMGDLFSIDDILIVRSSSDNRVQIESCFEVKFLKSTMFRALIESTTYPEMSKWLQELVACIMRHVEEKFPDNTSRQLTYQETVSHYLSSDYEDSRESLEQQQHQHLPPHSSNNNNSQNNNSHYQYHRPHLSKTTLPPPPLPPLRHDDHNNNIHSQPSEENLLETLKGSLALKACGTGTGTGHRGGGGLFFPFIDCKLSVIAVTLLILLFVGQSVLVMTLLVKSYQTELQYHSLRNQLGQVNEALEAIESVVKVMQSQLEAHCVDGT